ncbi:hypothetical protein WJX81_005137 [Elliptochloris bilobata]|uniref:N-acetylglucosaminylphosphatidylinositol deacetylase n=1 Tax=Elliptochloris bilobata TaxID=381761 RepID=A0AAW1SDT1_9CHLO
MSILQSLPSAAETPIGRFQSALLVIAHPDDETLFFLPTLQGLQAAGTRVAILCLSTGNADGMGSVRTEELRAACNVLNVASEDLEVVDHPGLQDGRGNRWSPYLILPVVTAAIGKHSAEVVITFDAWGVSGHPNHVAVSEAIRPITAR